MPKRAKEGSIDLFYMNKVDGADKKNAPKKNKKVSKKRVNKSTSKSNNGDMFNFDDEIVIGISNKKTETNTKKIKQTDSPKSRLKNKKKKRSPIIFLVKWTSILAIVVGTIIFILTTPMFNVKQINISGEEQLTEEQILSLSKLNIDENIFKNSKTKIINNIKENPYVENVTIKRKLPDTIEIQIEEKQKMYMLKFVNGYVYLSLQGYMLEISDNKLELPIIIGYKTEEENITSGGRLINDDLEKLGSANKIVQSLEEIEIFKEKITSIDISNEEDYIVYIESEKKTIHFGDASNLSNKILYVKSMIDSEKKVEGEIFVNGDLNSKFRPFFRERV